MQNPPIMEVLMRMATTTSGCGVNDALHILCFCTITLLRPERLRCGHHMCPYEIKKKRKGAKCQPDLRWPNGRVFLIAYTPS